METDKKNTEAAAVRAERKVTRMLFTKSARVLEDLLHRKEKDMIVVATQHAKVQELQNQITELDAEMRKLLRNNNDETSLETEMEAALEYKTRWLQLDLKFKNYTNDGIMPSSDKKERRFKLPTLQFITFDGDLRGWLPFWGQFQKIDSDNNIDPHDKYQYLLQAMKQDSEPKALVQSFSPISYQECLNQLKSRYAREDLLIQVYVRDLLGLINKVEDCSLTSLYDKINAMLRALETLGVTKDKFAAFLLPMIESALPQELLKIWERNKEDQDDISVELNNLLKFIKKEVESEQRLILAKKSLKSEKIINETKTEPTAGCLLTGTTNTDKNETKNEKPKKPVCVWCEKDTHGSLECYKMQKMDVEERRNHLREKKVCAICLKKGHHPKVCKASTKCLICGARHSVTLCTGQSRKNINTPIEATSTNVSAGGGRSTGTTLLQTVTVLVCNGEKQVKVRAMFDNGAQRSYIREDVARRLNLPVASNETLSHTLFGGIEITSKQYDVYDLKVMNVDKSFSFKLTALGQKCICQNIPKYKNDNLSHLLTKHNITLTDSNTNTDDVGLLIGADFSGLVLTGDMIQLHDTLVAIKTKLGWTLQGKILSPPSTHVHAAHVSTFCSTDISNYWSLETLGIRDPVETKTKQQNEDEVLATFQENVMVNNEGRYEVLLPWKVGHDELLNNHDVASRRLQAVTKKLVANNMYEDYDKVFKEWSAKGIIEIVPNPENDIKTSHYLPHRPVVKEKSLTTRIRPVFDASAKDRQGKSLNLCLDKGVNMLDKIPKLLNGFRKRAIGVTADIAKAFLQVSISPRERDKLRFLWWDSEANMITYHHCRVVFGLTSSPFLLSATIQHHLKQVSGSLKASAEKLSDSFYVDNCQISLDSEEEVQKFKNEAICIMNQAKFDLTQWAIAPLTNQQNNEMVSVLGLEWHTAEDNLSCNIQDFPSACELGKITKRNLLSLTQRIYDPIGFTSPVTLVPRLILQETWRRKASWDEEIPSDLKRRFINWYEPLYNLKYCKIPRRLTTTPFDESSLQLHMFCDASGDGYAACIYLRAEYKGNISVRMISAKSRVAPPEKLTIPRLELLAALIGSRLLAETRKDLKLQCKEYCWTDSGVALCWIKKELMWNTYVGNRVREIRQNTNIADWSHIPGTSNWADLASRGCDAAHLLSSRWLEGPPWLRAAPDQWPKSPLIVDESEANLELKKTTLCNTNTTSQESMTNKLTYFSKYSKIIRTVAWILRFAYNTNHKTKIRGELSYEEYEESEKRVIRLIQIKNRHDLEGKIQSLTHFYDKDGLLRIKTKLLLTDVPEATKFPAVLPATSCIVRRLAEQRHENLQHAGVCTVLADLRTRYWIIGARQLVKSIISKCNTCKRHRSKPIQAPAAPLPVERTHSSAPFEMTGVDLAGPLYLRNGEKCWIVIYTCAVYRAVHLELTKSLSTEAFVMTLRRFIARRGRVSVIMSDNGSNLVGTKNLLSELDWNEIQQQSTIQRIKWKLNAPTAAWWGGFWERLIKILKDLLKRVLGKSSVTYVELETLLCDCEATMNARPLTYIEDEKIPSLEPLRPVNFLQPIPQTDVTDIDIIDAKNLNLRLHYLQKLRDDFRQRFKTEYLTTLVQRGRERQDNLQIGDIVLVEMEGKRIKWPLGIIEEIFTGRDHINRTARVRTSAGYKVRPFQRLFKLEVSDPKMEFPTRKNTTTGKVLPPIRVNTPKIEAAPPSTPSFTPLLIPAPSRAQPEQPNVKGKATRCGRVARLPRPDPQIGTVKSGIASPNILTEAMDGLSVKNLPVDKEADRRRDAWIPNDEAKKTLMKAQSSPKGSFFPEREVLTMPGIVLEEELQDALQEVSVKYLGVSSAGARGVVRAEHVSRDEAGLRELLRTGYLRAAVNLTAVLLNNAQQGVGRMHRPSKHTPRTLQLWLCRFAVMLRIKLLAPLIKEAEPFGDLGKPDMYYQFYPDSYEGRTGSLVPFSLRLLLAELPQHAGKPEEALESLYAILRIIQQMLSNLREGKTEDGTGVVTSEQDKLDSIRLWSGRETRVWHSVVNCAIVMKDYRQAANILSRLQHQASSPTQKRALASALCRLWLLAGHVHSAANCLEAARVERHHLCPTPDVREYVDMGLLDIAHGKYQDAYNNFARAADQEPTNIMVANNLSVCLLYMGRLKEAIAVLQKAINSDPERGLNENLLINLCTLYELESSKTNEKKLNLLRMLCKYKSDTIPNVVECLKLS